MIVWHEPTDSLLAEFHDAGILLPSERSDLLRNRRERRRRRQEVARRGTFVAWFFLGAVISATSHLATYYAGRAVEATYTLDALNLARGYSIALEASLSATERTLPVCLSADERMHGLLEERAPMVWRVEP